MAFYSLTAKHLSAVSNMADKCQLDYAARPIGTDYIKGIVFQRQLLNSGLEAGI
jgi:hypothetical protein